MKIEKDSLGKDVWTIDRGNAKMGRVTSITIEEESEDILYVITGWHFPCKRDDFYDKREDAVEEIRRRASLAKEVNDFLDVRMKDFSWYSVESFIKDYLDKGEYQ